VGASTAAQRVLEAGSAAVRALGPALSPCGPRSSRREWADALGELQRVADVVAAAQDVAIAALAGIEEEWAEDGTRVEVHKAGGHVALDAPALVSGVLKASAGHAERRVHHAVRLAADAADGSGAVTGLGGLHTAMAAGRLDAYRATVVAEELEEAPAEVAASVVAAVAGWFDTDDGPALRRRCRRVLGRVSPDLVRQRARRARSDSRLERWASEPGVDCWHGTFPSEEAARAWAAIDALAHRYVADGVCAAIDRARAKALTDLVQGNATIQTMLTLVVPHHATDDTATRHDADGPAAGSAARHPDDPAAGSAARGAGDSATRGAGDVPGPVGALVEVAGARAGEPLLAERGWLEQAVAATTGPGRDRAGRAQVVAAHPRTGALVDPDGDLSSTSYRPPAALAALVRARDGRCRFPGCPVAARFCDLDHVRPWPAGPTAASNLASLCRRHHRVKQRPGWRLELDTDAVATWTDPTGRTRTTAPVDTLHTLVLPARPGEPAPEPPPRGRPDLPHGPHSTLEFTLEHRQHPRHRPTPPGHIEHHHHPTPTRELSPSHRHHRRRPPPAPDDDPPF
jgi:hypothetical protein